MANDPMPDYDTLIRTVRSLTLAQAKALIKDMNNANATLRMPLSGNKPEIITRIVRQFDIVHMSNNPTALTQLREQLAKYKSPLMTTNVPPPPPALNSATYRSPRPVPASSTRPSAHVGVPGAARVNFRPSPFWEIKQFLCAPAHCAEAPTSVDRKSALIYLTFNASQLELLKLPNYQVKLFCTTYEAQAASLSGRNPAPIEFPLNCDCVVNGVHLSTNLRGSKKKVGRVAPPNLNKDKALVLAEARPNKIELNYNSAAKRHVLIAALCEITSVETLVDQLRDKHYTSKQDVLSRMRKQAADDEIESGAATLSLKCPLSYMRVVTPCRSSFCPHVQCFDAYSFYSVNEQSPSWTCPVCNRDLRPENLVVDGYVDDILKRVPHDEDSVIVEPDGSWQTPDGKITSGEVSTPATPSTSTPAATTAREQDPKQSGKTAVAKPAVVLLDSSPSPKTASATTFATMPPVVSAPPTIPAVARKTNGGPVVQNIWRQTSDGSLVRHVLDEARRVPTSSPVALKPLPELAQLNSVTRNNINSGTSSPIVVSDVIDLTFDSDDEEASLPARPAVASHVRPTTIATAVGRSSIPPPRPPSPMRPPVSLAATQSQFNNSVDFRSPIWPTRSPNIAPAQLPTRSPNTAPAQLPSTSSNGAGTAPQRSPLPTFGTTTGITHPQLRASELNQGGEEVRPVQKRPRPSDETPPSDPRLAIPQSNGSTTTITATSPSMPVAPPAAKRPATDPRSNHTQPPTTTRDTVANQQHQQLMQEERYFDDEDWWSPET